jgi:hypothetical protein
MDFVSHVGHEIGCRGPEILEFFGGTGAGSCGADGDGVARVVGGLRERGGCYGAGWGGAGGRGAGWGALGGGSVIVFLAFGGDGATGGGHCAEFFEEGIPAVLGQCAQDLLLQVEGNGPELAVDAAAGGFEADAAGAPVILVGVALHPTVGFHALDQRGHGVGIAAHEFGQATLGEADALAFGEVAHDDELVRSDAEVGDPAAEGLIEAVPGVAQEDGKTFLGFGEDGIGCWVWGSRWMGHNWLRVAWGRIA